MEKTYFDESMSSSRFGQRCGEVLVQFTANSEISLPDQIRNMFMKVREMDRDMQDLERERDILQEELFIKAADFNKVCLPRELSLAEVSFVKEYPLKLIAHIDATVRSHVNDEYLKEIPLEPIRTELFAADKAVLVDLCVSLRQTVQAAHYIKARAAADEEDRQREAELRRQEEELRAAAAAEERERQRAELEERRRREAVQALHDKKQEQLRVAARRRAALDQLIGGDEFIKEGRGFFKAKSPRVLFLSEDEKRLCWRKPHEGVDKCKFILLSTMNKYVPSHYTTSVRKLYEL
jgi:hypothetical protein